MTTFSKVSGLFTKPSCRWDKFRVVARSPNDRSKEKVIYQSDSQRVVSSTTDIILDVGHNPAAIRNLMAKSGKETISSYKKEMSLIYTASKDKDMKSCLQIVLQYLVSKNIHFIQSKNWRAATYDHMNNLFKELTNGNQLVSLDQQFCISPSLYHAIKITDCFKEEEAKKGSSKSKSFLICGTGYVMSEIRAALKIYEPRL
jgi:folylpolyglutamate synthase/dihydropteroate synthase